MKLIAVLTIAIIIVVLYRRYKGYNWNNCPNDHDTMARNGAKRCNKCGNKL